MLGKGANGCLNTRRYNSLLYKVYKMDREILYIEEDQDLFWKIVMVALQK